MLGHWKMVFPTETIAVLKELGVNLLKDWPPFSPDVNIIEVVWAIMESHVEMRNPKMIQELKNFLIEVWDSLSWQKINGLVATMPERIRTVNDNPDKTIWRLTRI